MRLLVVVVAASLITRDYRSIGLSFVRSWDVLLYIAVLLLGLAWTTDMPSGFRTLETYFSLLAMPIVIGRFGIITQKDLNNIFKSFGLGVIVACIVCLVNAFIVYSKTSDANAFFYYELTSVIGSHPTYMAYFLIYVITIGLYQLYYRETELPRPLIAVVLVFSFAMLMLTGGSTAFISLLLIFSFFILKFTLEDRSSNKQFVIVMVSLMIISLFIINTFDFWQTSETVKSDYWERSSLWEAALRANPNALFGVGTGDDKLALNDYYMKHGLEKFANENYNSHNQLLQVYLATGIIGLLALIIILAKPMYLALRNQSPIGILVFFPFVIYGMNEVFMGRYQGVVFFALLSQLYTSYYSSLQPSVSFKST